LRGTYIYYKKKHNNKNVKKGKKKEKFKTRIIRKTCLKAEAENSWVKPCTGKSEKEKRKTCEASRVPIRKIHAC
jgi:hypothetical protein